MKNLSVIIIFFLFPFAVSIAEDFKITSPKERTDAGSKLVEVNPDQGVDLSPVERQEQEKRQEEFRKAMKRIGHDFTPYSQPGDPNWVEDTFDMPFDERLVGCGYAATYSYPSICTDEKGNVVFDYDRGDGQEVLDKIIKKQAKQGKYNKLPKERKIDNTVRSPMTSKILVGPPPTVIMPRWEDRVKDVK